MGKTTAGKASLVLGMGAFAFTLLLLGASVVAATLNGDSAQDVIGFLFTLAMGAHIVALGFGVEGLSKAGSRISGGTGVALNLAALTFWLVIVPLLA